MELMTDCQGGASRIISMEMAIIKPKDKILYLLYR